MGKSDQMGMGVKHKNYKYLKEKAKKKPTPRKIYMCVTQDKYELPVAVADSVTELAKLCGVPRNTIYGCLSRRFNSVYKCVEV